MVYVIFDGPDESEGEEGEEWIGKVTGLGVMIAWLRYFL